MGLDADRGPTEELPCVEPVRDEVKDEERDGDGEIATAVGESESMGDVTL